MHVLVAIVVMLLSFSGTAWAAGELNPDGSLSELAAPVFDAFMSGEYWYASALALVFAFAAFKKWGAPRIKFFRTDAGIGLMLAAVSFAGAMATGLAAGAAPSLAMLKTSLGVAVAAAGGYKLFLKPFVKPAIDWISPKLPFWLRPILKTVGFLFESGKETARLAKEAGEAAVVVDPGGGASDIVGEPRDIP